MLPGVLLYRHHSMVINVHSNDIQQSIKCYFLFRMLYLRFWVNNKFSKIPFYKQPLKIVLALKCEDFILDTLKNSFFVNAKQSYCLKKTLKFIKLFDQ